jgi:predicted enzyme related to lactoylglutathione lyase
MHKSRLAGFIIDCQGDDLSEAAAFWSQALGYRIKPSDSPEDDLYVLLDTGPDEMHIELQKVGHESRVHLDIEADDIEEEVRRLERLGARRVAQVKTWWVMEAPSGHRFCVVKPQRADFHEEANRWE